MLSLTDILDYSDVDRELIMALAEYHHVPVMLALQMSMAMMSNARGMFELHQTMQDMMAKAAADGMLERERNLREIYDRLRTNHPSPRRL